MKCPKINFSFNSIANAISIASGVTLAGIIGVGTYIYATKMLSLMTLKTQQLSLL